MTKKKGISPLEVADIAGPDWEDEVALGAACNSLEELEFVAHAVQRGEDGWKALQKYRQLN